jgi:hypothetical protein
MAREWIKLHVDKWLDGSTRNELSPAERAIWIDFLALAGRYQKDGKRDGLIITARDSLSRVLNVDRRLLDRAIEKFLEYGKITIDDEGIHIVNWSVYNPSKQEIYEDKHPFRHLPTSSDPILLPATLDRDLDRDLDKEIYKESFTEYLVTLSSEYPFLNVPLEWQACQLWWSEGKRKMKRPKSALANWLKVAETKRLERAPKTTGTVIGRDIPRL